MIGLEFLRDVATVISLSLTVPAVMGCLGVVWLWHDAAMKAWRTQHKTEMHWFVLGVSASFVGALVDNIYWGAAWNADYFNSMTRDALFSNGVYSNLVFRQGCTVFAAYCHVRAAVATDSRAFRLFITSSWIAGILLAVALFVTNDAIGV